MATDMKYCRKCGTENKRDAKFCKKCGTEFVLSKTGETTKVVKEEKFVCEYCDQPIVPGEVKCSHCDADIPENVRAKMSAASIAAKAKPKTAATEAPIKKQGTAKASAQADPRRVKTTKQPGKTAAKPVKVAVVPKKSGKKLIAAVTAVAVFLVTGFGYPGFLREKKGSGYSPSVVAQQGESSDNHGGSSAKHGSGENDSFYIDADSLKLEQLAEGTLTSEDRTLSEAGVTVSIDDGFMGDATERGIEINKVPETINYSFEEDVEVPLTVYEVNIDGIKEHSLLTIELPMDKDAAPLYGAGYIDEETGRLRPALNEYDPETGILKIHTTHLTKFCGIPISDEKTRYATLDYISGWDLLDEEISGQEDYRTLLALMENSLKNNGDKISTGLTMMDYLGNAQGIAGAGVSMAGVPDTTFVMQGAQGLSAGMDGAASKIYMSGNMGVVGYTIDPSKGTSTAQGLSSQFGWQHQRTAAYDDKLKATYPSAKLETIGKHLNRAGHALTLLRLCQGIYNDGIQSKGVAAEASKWAANGAMELYLKYGSYTAGLGIYMTGVGLFGMALDYVYSTALAGRKEAYIHAYQKYYSSNDGHWDDDMFIEKFREVMDRGGTGEEIKAGIAQVVDDYVRKFWKEADNSSDSYIASILTDDDRSAWGIAAQAGLTEEIKNEISENYKARIVKKRLPEIFRKMNFQMQVELVEKYNAEIEELRHQWNQIITLSISSEDRPENDEDESAYAGCVVRFKGLRDKVSDPENWECVLNGNGEGNIKFTLLAHMLAEAGNEIEVVKVEDGSEHVVHTGTISFRDDLDRAYGTGLYAVYMIPVKRTEEKESANQFAFYLKDGSSVDGYRQDLLDDISHSSGFISPYTVPLGMTYVNLTVTDEGDISGGCDKTFSCKPEGSDNVIDNHVVIDIKGKLNYKTMEAEISATGSIDSRYEFDGKESYAHGDHWEGHVINSGHLDFNSKDVEAKLSQKNGEYVLHLRMVCSGDDVSKQERNGVYRSRSGEVKDGSGIEEWTDSYNDTVYGYWHITSK